MHGHQPQPFSHWNYLSFYLVPWNPTILADRSDRKTAVPETPAITATPTPLFPPGRYGRRREPRRARRWPVAALAALALVASLAVAVRLYQQYGDSTYEPHVTGITDLTGTGGTVEFTVTVPAGTAAVCTVRARASSGEEVGRDRVEVRAQAGESRVTVVHRLTTTARPRVVEVPGCGPAQQD